MRYQPKVLLALLVTILISLPTFLSCHPQELEPQWPEVTYETKPWTRWWWMGNALTLQGITKALEEYKKAGIGGLEITPIYGVKGYEDRFIQYLSPGWVALLSHTLKEAERLDMGIDMATGTGWPFGGPWIDDRYACKGFSYKTYTLKEGVTLKEPVNKVQEPYITSYVRRLDISDVVYPVSANKNLQDLALEKVQFEKPLPLITLMAYSDKGKKIDLTDKVNAQGTLDWTAPEGKWTLYAIFMGWHGKMVERAAPGGEGNVLDHFSKDALHHYLNRFDSALHTTDLEYLRAFFNDSYEVDDAKGEANFSPLFLEGFKARKGYDLRNYFDILLATDSTDAKSRILYDYREVISDMLLDNFTLPWQEWAKNKQAIIRNQAHGSPANILDLYAASDIPETEGQDIEGMKFASSAAHIAGKPLVSSETATWLDEHFKASLAEVKQAIDNCFLGGINHIVYHGTAYSPGEETWPGWMFYAAVHFAPANTLWQDLPRLNAYVTRCQSFLQHGEPLNDILLYYPIHDMWSNIDHSFLLHFKPGLYETSASRLGDHLLKVNYSYDYISDRQLQEVTFEQGNLSTGKAEYKTIIVPETRYMPEATLAKLIGLAEQGAVVLFQGEIPPTVPGFGKLEERITEYQALKNRYKFHPLTMPGIREAQAKKGKILLFLDLMGALHYCHVHPVIFDPLDSDLRVIRRHDLQGNFYFIANKGEKAFAGNIVLENSSGDYVIFNPMNGKTGKARQNQLTGGNTRIYIRLEPGESCILHQYDQPVKADLYPYPNATADADTLTGEWTLSFTRGGPALPGEIKTTTLTSWTEYPDAKYFSGTVTYSMTFPKPELPSPYWLIDLGSVYESVSVTLNGTDMGAFICSPYQWVIPETQLQEKNVLELEVTNLMANRIIYMDQQGINYKKFYNVNFPSKYRENMNSQRLFDASRWEPLKSGLLGPVTITPVEIKMDQ